MEYKLNYDLNGGVGGPESAVVVGNENYVIFEISDITPHKDGYVFSGWSTKNSDSRMFGGDIFSVTNKETTVVANWTKAEMSEVIEEDAVSGSTEPLGVVVSSDSYSSGAGFLIGVSFIFSAIVLGAVFLLLVHKRQPKILSMEDIEDK